MLTATPRGRVSTLVDYLYMIPWILDQCNYFFELFYEYSIKNMGYNGQCLFYDFYNGKYQLNYFYTSFISIFHQFSVNVQIITLYFTRYATICIYSLSKITIQSK